MSIVDELITDRTQADVDYVAELASKGWANMTADEKTAWLAGLKGSYNATDLNRVGAAVRFIADEITAALGVTITVNPKTDWTVDDIPTAAQMATYLNDVARIRAAMTVPDYVPNVPDSMGQLDFNRANDIERILQAVAELVDNVEASFVPCGLPFSGQIWTEFEVTNL